MPCQPHLLVAWTEAWPFVSREAFDLRTRVLVRETQSVDRRVHQTTRLGETLSVWLRTRASGRSLDELEKLRLACWFGDSHDRIGDSCDRLAPKTSLERLLARIARRYLCLEGGTCELARHAPEGDGASLPRGRPVDLPHLVRRFRLLSMCLPADLLVAALAACEGVEPPCDHVSLHSADVGRVLEGGMTESHLHIGGAITFGPLWSHWLQWLGSPEVGHANPSDPEVPFGSWDRFERYSLCAAIARLLLAGFVWREDGHQASRHDPAEMRGFLREQQQRLAELSGYAGAELPGWLARAVRTLADGAPPPEAWELRAAYRALKGPMVGCLDAWWERRSRTVEDFSIGSVFERDPLASWLPPGPGVASPETRFLSRALRRARAPREKADELFEVLLWQYVRVRCLTYRYLTLEPGTAGLDWFRRYFGRLGSFRGRELDRRMVQSAVEVQGRETRTAALEVRTSPSTHWGDVLGTIKAVAEGVLRSRHGARRPVGAPIPELALVLHLVKSRDDELRRAHADPRRACQCRYGDWSADQRARVDAVEHALREFPEALLLLRGLDVAGPELAVPTWPTIDPLVRLRGLSRRLCARLARSHPALAISPLRVTYHVGEDYLRLVEGLRRIHEVIEFGVLVAGDRIGHGIALGDDTARLLTRYATSVQCRMDRLDDLLWELDRYANGDIAPSSRPERVREEARKLIATIYGAEQGEGRCPVETHREARRLRHDPATLRALGYPELDSRYPPQRRRIRERPGEASNVVTPEQVLWRYLTDPDVYDRGAMPIEIRASSDELGLLVAAQKWLRREVARLQLTVETNPSSNLFIADLGDLSAHPALQLQRLGASSDDVPISISVNSDDPITFATCLADEHAYLYYSLLEAGMGASDALLWIERVRQQGMRSRFTLAASSSSDALRRLVDALPSLRSR